SSTIVRPHDPSRVYETPAVRGRAVTLLMPGAPLDRGSQREAKAKVRLGHFTLEDHLPALQRESLHVSLGKLQFLLRAPLASVRRGGRIGLRCEATAEALQKEGPVRELEDAPGGIPVLEPCVPAGARRIADRALRCRQI